MTKPPQNRIPLMAGVPSRDYGLMQGANAKVKREPDGSQSPDQGDPGAESRRAIAKKAAAARWG